jgi:hypothetical protein
MTARPDCPLPVVRASELNADAPQARWLVESLWARAGVGILGGAPKCCKSWLALDVALSVASGTPCLDTFAIVEPGDVLLYMAEDAADIVRGRLDSIARHRGLDLRSVPLNVITAPSVRLDLDLDRRRLDRTLEVYKPRLLVLDPFVRLHRIRENDAGEVSAVLAYLRELQRRHAMAVLVVHHARKNGVSDAHAGQGLRGSGDFFAWADSLLYLQRQRDGLRLSIEHRAAAAPAPRMLLLDAEPAEHTHLRLREHVAAPDGDAPAEPCVDLPAAVLAALDRAVRPLTRNQLRAILHVRNQRLGAVLTELLKAGTVTRDGDRWTRTPVPVPPSP